MANFTIKKARISFANLLEPNPDQEMGGKYDAVLLIPKSDEAGLKALKGAINSALKEAVAEGRIKAEDVKKANFKMPLRDGDEKEGESFKGNMFLSVKSGFKPLIIDKKRNKLTTDEEVYSGMYAAVAINFYTYSNKGNMGIAAGLQAVCKLEDGPRLSGGSVDVEESFGAFLEEDDFSGIGKENGADEDNDDFI